MLGRLSLPRKPCTPLTSHFLPHPLGGQGAPEPASGRLHRPGRVRARVRQLDADGSDRGGRAPRGAGAVDDRWHGDARGSLCHLRRLHSGRGTRGWEGEALCNEFNKRTVPCQALWFSLHDPVTPSPPVLAVAIRVLPAGVPARKHPGAARGAGAAQTRLPATAPVLWQDLRAYRVLLAHACALQGYADFCKEYTKEFRRDGVACASVFLIHYSWPPPRVGCSATPLPRSAILCRPKGVFQAESARE